MAIDNPGIQYRIVTPDYCICDASPDLPDKPNYYQELRLRTDPQGKHVWVWDIFDIRNLNNPRFGMYKAGSDGSIGIDVSEDYMGHPAHIGLDAYPYIDSSGTSVFFPLHFITQKKTGMLWKYVRPKPTSIRFFTICCILFVFSLMLYAMLRGPKDMQLV